METHKPSGSWGPAMGQGRRANSQLRLEPHPDSCTVGELQFCQKRTWGGDSTRRLILPHGTRWGQDSGLGTPGQEPHEQNKCQAGTEERHREQVPPSKSASSGRVGTKPCRCGQGFLNPDWDSESVAWGPEEAGTGKSGGPWHPVGWLLLPEEAAPVFVIFLTHC